MGEGGAWNSSTFQGEVGRVAGRRGSAEAPLTPSVGFADSSPLGEQLEPAYAVQMSMIRPKPRMSPVVVGAMRFMA